MTDAKVATRTRRRTMPDRGLCERDLTAVGFWVGIYAAVSGYQFSVILSGMGLVAAVGNALLHEHQKSQLLEVTPRAS